MWHSLLGTTIVGVLGTWFHRLPLPWYVIYSDVWKFFSASVLPGWPYVHNAIEYPVFIGLFSRAMGVLGVTPHGYYFLSSFVLVLFALGTTYLLYRMSAPDARKRLWVYWVFAPSLFIFLTMNWDIFAAFFSVAAFYAMQKERYILASFFIGLGFSAKFYPLLYLIPLVFLARRLQDRVRVVGTFAVTVGVINAPFAILNFEGWWHFFKFNQLRDANFDSDGSETYFSCGYERLDWDFVPYLPCGNYFPFASATRDQATHYIMLFPHARVHARE
jgi:hypothetical protein